MWWRLLPVLAGLMAMSAMAGEQPDPTRLLNPAAAPLVETWNLREVWRLGGDDDPPGTPLLGVISHGRADDQGNVFLLDVQLGHVLMVAPDGTCLRTIGRQGDGPGEIRRPADICLDDDGTIVLLQSFPVRIVKLHRDGTPAGNVQLDNPAINLWRLRSAAGLTVVTGQRNDYEMKTPGQSTTYRFIASLTADGERDRVYLDRTHVTQWQPPVSDEGNSYFPGFAWDLLPDGTVVLAPERDRYLLRFIDRDGQVVREAERPCEPHRRTEAEKDEVRERMSMTSNGKRLEVRKIVLDTEPVIRSLQVLRDGTIWVATGAGGKNLPDGVFQRYDVFDAEGRLRKEVHLVCPAREDRDGFGVLADGRFIWIRNQTSAYRGMYPGMPGDDEDDEDGDDVLLEVIVLARAG